MTTEVAIFNSQAIALAADSAVTIGNQKTYNSAIKLFALSKYAPIGVMIYGKADLLGVPWELIIKSYRNEKLKSNKLNTVETYANDFINYIQSSNFISKISESSWVMSKAEKLYMSIRDELSLDVHEHFKSNKDITNVKTLSLLKEIIVQRHEELSGFEYSLGMDLAFEKKLRNSYQVHYKRLITDIFENLELSNQIKSKLYDIATFIITRAVGSTRDNSGIVIAGYGENEYFPSVITHEIYGLIDGKLKYRFAKERSRSYNESSATIIPFADDHMITTFMQGISPTLTDFVTRYVFDTFGKLPDIIEAVKGPLTGKESEALLSGIENLIKSFVKSFDIHKKIEQVDPVMRMVEALPKDELAAMAESLVSLTAFKRKMSREIESVGGPIDVAVISKGDGLVWVKRKHYFPSELNHNFLEKYLNEC